MELSILESCGLPEGSILSVRSGPTRRQSPLPCLAPFRLPAGPWPIRIDVLALLGKSQHGASITKPSAEGCCRVPLEARDGRTMSVTLQVYDMKGGYVRPKTAPNLNGQDLEEPEAEADAMPNSMATRRRDTEAEARSYLDRHRLHEFMHALFEMLLRERPEDPYAFIAKCFKEAAQTESKSISRDLLGSRVGKALSMTMTGPIRASPDTTLSRTAPIVELPALSLPEGAFQVVVKTMRSRALVRMALQPTDKVWSLKKRLEVTVGVPAASQQLFWWAEAMPNDSTLEECGVPSLGTLHLVRATRDPRLLRSLSGASDGGLRMWNLQDGEFLGEFGADTTAVVLSIAAHWESMRALTGSFDGRLHLWNLEARSCLAVLEGHSEEVCSLDVDWKRLEALSGSGDRTARLWDLERLQCLQVFDGGVTFFSVAADWIGRRAFGGLRNGHVRAWDMATGSILHDWNAVASITVELTNPVVSSFAIDCIGARAVSGLEDGHVIYWHFPSASSATNGASQGKAATGIDGEEVHGGSASSAPTLRGDAPAATPKAKVLLANYSAVRAITARWQRDQSKAIFASDDGSLSLWRLDSQECVARFARHIGFVWTIFADWALERAISGAFDGCLKLWDLRTGDCLRTFQGHSRPVRSVSAS